MTDAAILTVLDDARRREVRLRRARSTFRTRHEAAVVELDKARAAELAAAETYRDARQRRTVAEEKVAAVRAALDAAIAGTGETTDA